MRAPAGRSRVAVVLSVVALVACREHPEAPPSRLSLTRTLGGADTAGYRRAVTPRPFRFPEDHGPHPGFRSEWWYLTGNLDAEDGRRFGFQLTFFRTALAPAPPASASAWATNQAYMAHFALTDVNAGTFRAFERFGRGAAGLAGARAEPFRVWLDDWTVEGSGGEAVFPIRVRVADEGAGLSLALAPAKPVVAQGERGLSRKGPEAGNASYYYSLTRMTASGQVRSGSDTVTVGGTAWLDREWSTSALSKGLVGWDWFALQLEDGRELMAYRLRAHDGSSSPFSEGVLVAADGTTEALRWGRDVTIAATGSWTSASTGATYPSGWRVDVPSRGLRLAVEPWLDEQELDLSFRYWEGAVRVRSLDPGGPSGRGYVELTGYDGAPPG